MFTLNDFRVGNRVQLAAHTDLWMRGARYGEVILVTAKKVHVRLDATDRTVSLPATCFCEIF